MEITITNAITKKLLKNNLIYKSGNKASYRKIVGGVGLMSVTEHRMIEAIRDSSRKLRFRDTEFPIDEFGYYTIRTW